MYVQDSAGAKALVAVDDDMQARLGGRPALSLNCPALKINFKKFSGRKRSLIESSWRNKDAAARAHAEVAAGGRHPTARVAGACRGAQCLDFLLYGIRGRKHP